MPEQAWVYWVLGIVLVLVVALILKRQFRGRTGLGSFEVGERSEMSATATGAGSTVERVDMKATGAGRNMRADAKEGGAVRDIRMADEAREEP